MKETLNLTKILLKNSFNKNMNNNESIKKRFTKSSIVILAILYIVAVMIFLSYELINTLHELKQEEVFLTLCLVMSIGVTVIRTIFTALNVLYFSKDVEFLLPLPIKPIKIVFAKFNVMLISEYITELITFAIPFCVYGYVMKLNFVFYIYSILVFLFIPIIPMLIATGIIVIIMRFTKFLNNKDFVQYFTVFLTIVLVIGMQFLSTSSAEVTDFMIANKLIEINGLVSIFADYFFTLKQGMLVFRNLENIEAIKNILLLAVESVLAYVIVAYLVSKIYVKTAIAATYSSNKSKKMGKNMIHKQNTGIAYIKKEFKTLFRNPVFFLQCVLPSILFPIIFSIPLYNAYSQMKLSDIQILADSFLGVLETGIGLGMILVIINFMYLFNYISVTAVSRDGENAIFMKYIPIELYTQCKYKAIPSIVLNIVPLIYIIFVIKYVIPSVTWITIAEIFWLGLLTNILVSYITLIIDLIRPKLHWTSEYSVVKQNMNMLYSSIVVIVVMGVILVISSYFDNIHVLNLILTLVCICVLGFYELFLRIYSRQVFSKIS